MKVSSIVSAYYAEPFIQGRIDNLLEQTGVDFEVIVSCAENSVEHEILKGYGSDIVLIVTKGIPMLYATWNELIKVAKGEYITNSNSDDRLYPGALELLANVLDNNNDAALVYADDDIVPFVGGDPVNRHLWPEGGFFELVHGCFVGPMPMWRKSLHNEYGYFDDAMHSSGDYEFWLRITHGGEKLLHYPQVIGAYTRREDGIEKREGLRTTVETARARSRYVNWKTLYNLKEQ